VAWLALAPVLGAAEVAPRALALPGIENAYQVSERILAGGQPEGDEAFAALRERGVRTLVSVDGARPDVERAARFGLRYIHLPHGYDGIPTNTVLSLIRAAEVSEGSLFLHCHHGRHRGPAAAAVLCQATAGWTTNEAVRWMKRAGTAPDYAGLYRVNTAFQAPARTLLDGVPTNFPSVARVSGLVEGMVELDRRWEHLKAAEKAGWRVPPDHPDLVPAREALLLHEAYRELRHSGEVRRHGPDFVRELAEAADTAAELHALLKEHPLPLSGPLIPQAAALFRAAGRQCAACHQQHRN
jgi:protein tyrosine phosphatase (PTP) superfamily phosphohydrolase (DUF442 family)